MHNPVVQVEHLLQQVQVVQVVVEQVLLILEMEQQELQTQVVAVDQQVILLHLQQEQADQE